MVCLGSIWWPVVVQADIKMGGDVRFERGQDGRWAGQFGVRNEFSDPSGPIDVMLKSHEDIWLEWEGGKKTSCEKLEMRVEVSLDKSSPFRLVELKLKSSRLAPAGTGSPARRKGV